MAKYYVTTNHSPILHNLHLRNLTKTDLVRHLSTTMPTLNTWIQRPMLIPLDKIVLMAGLFGLPAEEFVYCLIRNKPTLSKQDKFGKWFLEDIRERNKEE